MVFATDKQLKERIDEMENESEDIIQNKGWKVKRKNNTEEGMQKENAVKGITYLSWSPIENKIKHLTHV